MFARYIYDAIRKYPILNQPTKLDFGSARIIVLNLQEVAPTGSAASNRQTEMMYLLGRHILARNFFLRPDYVHYVPEAVRPYHAKRFREAYETVKRLDYDEWHRTLGSPQVRAQAELDAREGRKHNIQLGFASQRLSDMGDALISQSTGRFVLQGRRRTRGRGNHRALQFDAGLRRRRAAWSARTGAGRGAVPRHHADRELKI